MPSQNPSHSSPQPGSAGPPPAAAADEVRLPAMESEAAVAPLDTEPRYDGWELEEQLRHVQRVLAIHGAEPFSPAPSAATRRSGGRSRRRDAAALERQSDDTGEVRFDAPHIAARGWHVAKAAKRSRRRRRNGWTHAAAWLFLCLGLMALAFGVVLWGWSLAADRPELWQIGGPAALAGQVLLVLGLILHLDGLWHETRSATAALARVDERLARLGRRRTLGRQHGHERSSPPASALADIERRLDQLSEQIERAGS